MLELTPAGSVAPLAATGAGDEDAEAHFASSTKAEGIINWTND